MAGVSSIIDVEPLHVAVWIESKTRQLSAPTVKQHLAALRHMFDWLVTGQIVAINPASSVRGPSHVVKTGKTPILDAEEARHLLASIDATTHAGLRDRALIAAHNPSRPRPIRNIAYVSGARQQTKRTIESY